MEVESAAYSKHLLGQLNTLRDKRTLCDVTIQGRELSLHVHRVILCAASPYFANYIQSKLDSPEPVVIDLSKFDNDLLKIVVDFLYSGRLKLTSKTVNDFVKVFEELELKLAADECKDFIKHGGLKFKEIGIQTENDLEAGNEKIEPEVSTRKKRKVVSVKKTDIPSEGEEIDAGESEIKRRPRKIGKPRRRKSLPKKLKVKNVAEEKETGKNSHVKSEKDELDGNSAEDSRNPETIVKVEKDDLGDVETSELKPDKGENGQVDSDTDDYDSGVVDTVKDQAEILDDHIKTIDDEGRVVKKQTRKRRGVHGELKLKKGRRRKPFPCSLCSKTLTSKKRLIFHEFSKHGTPIDYKSINFSVSPCGEEGCNYVAANRHNLDIHMKSRHGNARPHVCEFCGKAFKLPNILATHLNIHTNSKAWKCEHCGETFNQQSGLQVHVKRYHMGEASWSEMCHMCSDKFLQKADLAWHLYKVHDQALPENYKMYTCDVCGFSTMKAQQLKQHRERHDGIKNFICPICQKGCSTKSELRRHVSFHGEKKYKCLFEGCAYACTDSIGLDKHIKLMHTHKDFKPYACPVCQYRTGVKGNVDKHIRAVHDLIVVTKHTVNLKMKYSDFDSGDVITKDGRLVATAKERKALQQIPATMDKHMAMSHNSEVETSLNNLAYDEFKMKEPVENTYLNIKKSKRHKGFRMEMLKMVDPDPDKSMSMQHVEGDDSDRSKMETIIQDLPPLNNYVYIQNEMAVAQDLRLAAVSGGEHSSMYNIGSAEMYNLQPKY